MDLLTYLQIFASFWCSALLTFAVGLISYKLFALILAIISLCAIIFCVVRNRQLRIPKPMFAVLIVYIVLILLYSLTPQRYSIVGNESHHSLLLALVGQVFPAALTATIVAQRIGIQVRIKRLAPFISLIFCLLAVYAVLFPTSETSAGLADNDNGLNYQSASYLSAYAAALAEFFLINNEEPYNLRVTKSKPFTVLVAFSVFVDFLTLLLAGGRGGLAAFLIILVYTMYVAFNKGKLSKGELIKICAVILFLVVAGYAGIRIAGSSNVTTTGFRRIEYYFRYGELVGDKRLLYQKQAIEAFKTSPIFGHGLGSIFYESGRYSHNCFTDALAEVGIVGTLLFSGLLIKTILNGVGASKNNATEAIWVYFFLCGFAMSLFSGYYLTHIPMYWGISFILSKKWFEKRRRVILIELKEQNQIG